jgi:hypothetical protein
MPRRKSRKGSAKKSQGGVITRITPPSKAISYRGPLSTTGMKQQDHTYTAPLHYSSALSSSAAGAISGNIDMGNPSGGSGWSTLAGVWDEFRVLGAKVKYVPVDRYDAPVAVTTSVNQPPLLVAIDRDSSATPSTTAQIQAYESCDIHGLSDPFSLSWKMDGVVEAEFVTTAAPTGSRSRGLIWLGVANSATVSTTFGYWFITFLVQFRGLIG